MKRTRLDQACGLHGLRVLAALPLVILVSASCAVLPASLGGTPKPAWEAPPPPPEEGPIVEEGTLHRSELANGITILILEDDRLPRVSLGIELRRGAGSVAVEKSGVAAIASEVMQRGAGDRDTFELAAVVEAAVVHHLTLAAGC